MLNREKKPSEFEEWKDYVKEKQMKYFWRDKMSVVLGEFPEICPLAVPEGLGKLRIGGECKCSLYVDNKDKDCECWFKFPPSLGRCDCFRIYWRCSLFRDWLKVKEINIVVKQPTGPIDVLLDNIRTSVAKK